jgi:hypothetical protein
MDAAIELSAVAVPWSGELVRPALRGPVVSLAEATVAGGRRISFVPNGETCVEVPIPGAAAARIGAVSIPLAWIPASVLAAEAASAGALGPAGAPGLSLALDRPGRIEFCRRDERTLLRILCGPCGASDAAVSLELCSCAAPAPALHRDVPDAEAARLFLSFFPVLDLLEPESFGEPTQAHRKTLAALASARARFRNLKQPKHFEPLWEDRPPFCPGFPPTPARPGLLAGYVVAWETEGLLFVRGRVFARIPGAAPARWHVLGEGEIALRFPEDVKGLTALTYDSYGRPRRVRGGGPAGSYDDMLSPGEQIRIEGSLHAP